MVPEAPLESAGNGRAPKGEGWFVLNVREARWLDGDYGAYTRFEGDARFPQLGFNIGVLQPGQPSCMYHGEEDQEDFLVLAGECLLIVEGEERKLKTWDFFHCPPETEHIIVGAGEEPAVVLAVGARGRGRSGIVYPVSESALEHKAGVERETSDPSEAYGGFDDWKRSEYREGWLPDL